jgi:(4S)-4-hydroxy-5-phosphonooxypentane-2,3-dione isomerase
MYSQMYAFDIVPEHREDFRALSLKHTAECLEEEPGTLRFDAFQDDVNENRFYAFETYADYAAFEAHRDGNVLKQNFPEFAPMLAGPPTLLGRGFNLEPSGSNTDHGA